MRKYVIRMWIAEESRKKETKKNSQTQMKNWIKYEHFLSQIEYEVVENQE